MGPNYPFSFLAPTYNTMIFVAVIAIAANVIIAAISTINFWLEMGCAVIMVIFMIKITIMITITINVIIKNEFALIITLIAIFKRTLICKYFLFYNLRVKHHAIKLSLVW